jgi:acyl carrier protein
MEIANAINAAIEQVLRDTAREVRSIEPGMRLAADLGLDSLDLAQTIVLLERSLGVDPFRQPAADAPRPSLRTVSDLITIYSAASSHKP